ncbi:MAG TPA: tRNA methyl transferase PRC-barrel domain-containing protein, partial [Chloroflexota bacterium]
DSQEICFVAGNNYKEFLRRYAGVVERPGEIVDADGSVLGRHDGVHGFTIGQRRGLGIATAEPRYVTELRPAENLVVVGGREDVTAPALACSRLSFTGRRPEASFSATIKIRYRTPDRPGRVLLTAADSARVDFQKPVWGIAPGQLAVFYDGDRVIGGGTIDSALAAA